MTIKNKLPKFGIPNIVPIGFFLIVSLISCTKDSPSNISSVNNDALEMTLVRDFTVSYDTGQGVAILTWKAPKSKGPFEYLIYRDGTPAYSRIDSPLGITKDLIFIDSIYWDDQRPTRNKLMDTISHYYEYRIKTKANDSLLEGSSNSVAIQTVAPIFVSTKIDFTISPFINAQATIGDTLVITANYKNSLRRNVDVRWSLEKQNQPSIEKTLNSFSGSDSFSCSFTTTGKKTIQVQFQDETGATWIDTQSVEIISDPPLADAGPDATLGLDQKLALHGSGSDRFGHIVKWEWNIGPSNSFITTSKGDTSIAVSTAPNSTYSFILKVTDDDGEVGLDTVNVRVNPWTEGAWTKKADRPTPFGLRWGMVLCTFQDKLYAYGTNSKGNDRLLLNRYDPSLDTWTEIPNAPNVDFMIASDSLIFMISKSNDLIHEYNPITGTFRPMSLVRGSNTSYHQKETLFTLNNILYNRISMRYHPGSNCCKEPWYPDGLSIQFEEYDRISESWKARFFEADYLARTGIPDALYQFTTDDSWFITGTKNRGQYLFNSDRNSWDTLPMLPFRAPSARYSVGSLKSRLLVTDGIEFLLEYDPEFKQWISKAEIPKINLVRITEPILYQYGSTYIIIYQGQDGEFFINIYNHEINKWSYPVHISNRQFIKHSMMGGKLYFISDGTNQLGSTQVANPHVFEVDILKILKYP